MSICDYEKTLYKIDVTCYNLKQLKKIVQNIEKDYKKVDAGIFNAHLIVEYNDRGSDI